MLSVIIDSSNEDFVFQSRKMLTLLQNMCKLIDFIPSYVLHYYKGNLHIPLLIVMFTGNFVFLGLLLGIYKNLSPNLPETIITLVVAISMRILGDRYWGDNFNMYAIRILPFPTIHTNHDGVHHKSSTLSSLSSLSSLFL